MKKKILLFTMISALAISLTACGSSSDKNAKKNDSTKTTQEDTGAENMDVKVDIKDEEYDSNINYICKDGMENGEFSFLLSQPEDKDMIIGTYKFKDLDKYTPVQSNDSGYYSFISKVDDTRQVSFRSNYDYPYKKTYIDDTIWNANENEDCVLEVSYSESIDNTIDLQYMENRKDEDTIELYQENDCFVFVTKNSEDSYVYKIYSQIPDICMIEIVLYTDEKEINKTLVKEVINGFSFEYVSSDAGTGISNKSLAEDTISQILSEKYNIYLKNPISIAQMDSSEIIYVFEENTYKLIFETLPEIKSSYELFTQYNDFDVYYKEGSYILYQKEGNFQISISSDNLDSMEIAEGYDLVRQLFLK